MLLVNKARDDSAWVVHTAEVENQTNALLLEIRRAESAARGYLLTSAPELLQDHEDAVAQIVPDLDKLAQMTVDNPAQRENIRKIRAAIETRLGQFAQEMQFVKSGALDKAAQLVREAAAHDTTSAIRDIGAAMRDEESRLLVLRTDQRRSQPDHGIERDDRRLLSRHRARPGLDLAGAACGGARDAAETSLRDNNVNLEATVDERTADLREANKEIQRFAYIVSHDLRSPLVNIMGFTSELEELRDSIFRRIAALGHAVAAASVPVVPVDAEPALEGEDRQLSEDFTEALGFIKSSIAKMDRLISAILNLTREGKREFEPVRIDMRELIEAIISTLAHQAEEAKAEIHVAPLPDIVSDRLALEQIFSNIIDNAIKYLKPGVPGEIAIRGRTKLGFAVFEISRQRARHRSQGPSAHFRPVPARRNPGQAGSGHRARPCPRAGAPARWYHDGLIGAGQRQHFHHHPSHQMAAITERIHGDPGHNRNDRGR